MRKLLVPIFALIALSGCDNPEDFTHPENPKKEVKVVVAPPTTTTPTDGSATTAPTTNNDASLDNSPPKSAGANGITGAFDKVNVSAALQADITVGPAATVNVDCNQNSFDKIKFEITDGTLNVTTDKGFSAATAKVSISMPTIAALSSGKSSLVKVTGVTGTNLAVNVQDMSSVELDGTVDNIVASTTNSCLVKMKNLTAKTGTVASSGRSVLEVKCMDSIVATSSGDSVITIYGKPRRIIKNKTDKSIITLGIE